MPARVAVQLAKGLCNNRPGQQQWRAAAGMNTLIVRVLA